MITVGDILKYLCDKYPLDTACEYDNCGLLAGDKSREVKKAVVCLDCDFGALTFAKKKGANLIITHHPVIFNPIKSVTEKSPLFSAVEGGISIISMHTNLDVAKGGVTDCLCKVLSLGSVRKYVAGDGFEMRSAKTDATAEELAALIKERLGYGVRYAGAERIKNVLVCSGGGGDYIGEVIKGGFDALISADIKHHLLIEAVNNNVCAFDCGHYASENVIVAPLCSLLSKKFKGLEFFAYNNDMIKYI